MLNRKKRLALILNFELLLPDDDIIGKIMEMIRIWGEDDVMMTTCGEDNGDDGR